jgi:hypothetical protein
MCQFFARFSTVWTDAWCEQRVLALRTTSITIAEDAGKLMEVMKLLLNEWERL